MWYFACTYICYLAPLGTRIAVNDHDLFMSLLYLVFAQLYMIDSANGVWEPPL